METAVWVALIGFAGVLVTAVAGVAVVILNGRGERHTAADNSVTAVLRERLTFKDEKLTEVQADLGEALEALHEARTKLAVYENQLPAGTDET